MRFTAILFLVAVFATAVPAQRPRTIETSSETATASKPAAAPAPPAIKAKYEGGVLGYKKKQDGTLFFDDVNSRLLFKDKHGKEVLFIPYDAVTQTFADTQSRRPTAAEVASRVPVPYGLNLPALLIKKKYRYLTLQFYDDESKVSGLTSFKMDNKEIVESAAQTLAHKAGLVPRGEIFVRDRRPDSNTTASGRADSGSNKPSVFVENEALGARVISLPRPAYPEEAKTAKTSGTVRVLVTVDERGRVADAEAVSGPSILQGAAVDAAKQAIFEPVLKEGQPVKTKAVIAYYFQAS